MLPPKFYVKSSEKFRSLDDGAETLIEFDIKFGQGQALSLRLFAKISFSAKCSRYRKNHEISQIAMGKRQIVKPGWWRATETGGIIKAQNK